MYKYSQRSINNLKGIHPDLVKVMTEAIKDSPYDFTITGGARTTEQQLALYAKGRTKPGPIVTYTDGIKKKSNHQVKSDGYGYAVDLYPYYNGSVHVGNHKIKGEVAEVEKRLKAIANHIKNVAKSMSINIGWGGDWKSFKDTPHFELLK